MFQHDLSQRRVKQAGLAPLYRWWVESRSLKLGSPPRIQDSQPSGSQLCYNSQVMENSILDHES